MKTKLLFITFICTIAFSYAQQTYVPDNNFENYLETHNADGVAVPIGSLASMGNGIANDNYVYTSRINSVITLDVNNQNIADLTGIEDFTTLTTLFCNNNQLTSLNVTQNTALINLYCNSNQLTSIDVSQNTALTYFYCYLNQLTNLDVSQNTALAYFKCYNNQLTSLDVSQNVVLFRFYCYNNQLTSLNVKNGNNTNIGAIEFKAANNPNLTCIEVDNPTWSTTNWTDIDTASSFSVHCPFGETYVPDNNFEKYLETHNANGNMVTLGDPTSMGNGIANDDYVTTANINTVTTLNVSSKNIADLTGIKDFISLQHLYCQNNQLTSLDVTGLANLQTLDCRDNQLTSLDVTSLVNLQDLICEYNQLTSLAVTSLTNLQTLDCQNNQLTSLDVSGLTNLYSLWCNSNQLTFLDVTNLTNLLYLLCENNQLTSLDLSQNAALSLLNCSNNQLTSLNVKNGNNTNFTYFRAIQNPNLTCIEVDDDAYSTANWPYKDATATYVNNQAECTALAVEDYNYTNFSVFPNPTKHTLNIAMKLKATYKLLNMQGQTLKTGKFKNGANDINTTFLPTGIYYLTIKTSEGMGLKKIIKQ